jgi:acetyl esterase/lipase
VRRVLLVSAARDCLAVEVEELGDRLGTVEGMSVVCERVEGCGHAWDKVAKEGSWGWEEKVRVYGMVVDLLKTV